jgi:hypothetical protein
MHGKDARQMAAETQMRRSGIGRNWRGRVLGAAYGRAVALSLLATAGLAGLATYASQQVVTSGTILLFAREQWPFWLAGALLAVATGVLVARFAARRQSDEARLPAQSAGSGLPTTPLLPAVTAFSGVLLVSIYHDQTVLIAAPALIGLALLLELIARYHLDDPLGRVRRLARTAHVLLTHGVAFLALAAIYLNKVRSLLSATTVALLACLLLLQIADGERFPAERRLIYALAGGVILGEITWALNYWPLTGWTGGALLLIAFYLLAGLILAQVREGLRRRDLLEYGLSSAIMFALVVITMIDSR